MPPPPDLGTLSFAQVERLAGGVSLPPVDRWDPPLCGDSGMRIARDGSWFHDGGRIERPALVQVLARILRREDDGGYVLVTPHEKLTIAVDDAPFVAVELRADGIGQASRLAFRLDTGEIVLAGPDHPLSVIERAEGPRPYLGVRRGLDAVVARPVYYQLVDRAVEQDGRIGVWSEATFFPLDAAS